MLLSLCCYCHRVSLFSHTPPKKLRHTRHGRCNANIRSRRFSQGKYTPLIISSFSSFYCQPSRQLEPQMGSWLLPTLRLFVKRFCSTCPASQPTSCGLRSKRPRGVPVYPHHHHYISYHSPSNPLTLPKNRHTCNKLPSQSTRLIA